MSKRIGCGAVFLVFALAVAPVNAAPALPTNSQGAYSIQKEMTIRFSTREGTWMSIDITPDGKTIVFDILGKIYAMSPEGGTAEAITRPGLGWDYCPRFSPDGRHLAFLSDREGAPDIWLMDWQTRSVRKISDVTHWWGADTDEYFMSCAPQWAPDGKELVTRELVMTDGKARLNFVSVVDGKMRHVSLETLPHSTFQTSIGTSVLPKGQKGITAIISVAQNRMNTDLYRVDLTDGSIERLRSDSDGNALAPELSPSGRWLAYLRRKSLSPMELRLRDLRSGEDKRLAFLHGLEQYTEVSRELIGYTFTPDETAVLIGSGGKIHRISTADGADTVVEFEAEVERAVHPPLRANWRIEDGPIRIRARRWPQVSQDGATLVFSAAGSIWRHNLPDGAVEEIGAKTSLNLMPALSPDGKQLAYLSFDLEGVSTLGRGRLMIRSGGEEVELLGKENESYYWPSWSPDQRTLAVVRRLIDGTAELGSLDLSSRTFTALTPVPHLLAEDFRAGLPRWLSWSDDGKFIFVQDFGEWAGKGYLAPISLVKISAATGAREVLASAGRDVLAMVPSPDLRHAVLIGYNRDAYLVSLPQSVSGPVLLSITMPDAKRIGSTAAMYPRWVGPNAFTYSWSDRVFRHDLDGSTKVVAQTSLSIPRKASNAVVAYTGARLLTMSGESGTGLIERGTIVTVGRRILAVGPAEVVSIPEGARIVDAAGMTIMPGLVDTHIHGISPATISYLKPGTLGGGSAALDFGITTPFDPGGGSFDDSAEDWRATIERGRIYGPRWFFDNSSFTRVGPKYKKLTSADLETEIDRKIDLGMGPCLKELSIWDGALARRIAESAGKAGLCVVAHVEGHPIHTMSRVANGVNIHHDAWPVPMFEDMRRLVLASGVGWTPHFALEWSSELPRDVKNTDGWAYLLARMKPLLDEEDTARFARYYSVQSSLGASLEKARGRSTESFYLTQRPRQLAQAKALVEAGVPISLSGHDRFAVLRDEMLNWIRGGFSPAETLRAATIGGAEQLGLASDLGSLEAGKIADFMLLKANPLDDVLNTLRIKSVVHDGLTIADLAVD